MRKRTSLFETCVHPWQGDGVHGDLKERVAKILNQDSLKFPELDQMGYCHNLQASSHAYYRFHGGDAFEKTLRDIQQYVCFADNLSFNEILRIAKRRLKEKWSHETAYALLRDVEPSFDGLRTFLKRKDPALKLTGYADVDQYDLSQTLSLEDFEGEDSVLISHGLPAANFRSASFIKQITDSKNRLRLISEIKEFQVQTFTNARSNWLSLVWNCERHGEEIRFHPDVQNQQERRPLARKFAKAWRKDKGRYCFTSDRDTLTEKMEAEECVVAFPRLRYTRPTEPAVSSMETKISALARYGIDKPLTASDSAKEIRAVLKQFGVSMTGRKKQLAAKLTKLAAEQYQKEEKTLNAYFTKNRFLRARTIQPTSAEPFPVLNDHPLKNLLLTMYALRHLRGNIILEAKHKNETYDIQTLAKAVIAEQISIQGSFLRVEGK